MFMELKPEPSRLNSTLTLVSWEEKKEGKRKKIFVEILLNKKRKKETFVALS